MHSEELCYTYCLYRTYTCTYVCRYEDNLDYIGEVGLDSGTKCRQSMQIAACEDH